MRLILDEHFSLAIKRGLERVGFDVIAVSEWQGQRLRSAADDHILITAAVERRILVTYDLKTVRPLAHRWIAEGRHHAGIIFIDESTFRQNDIGGIVRAIQALASERGTEDWQNQTAFLQR
jgi:hypothetical protein